jgi:universal stress protein A
LIKPQTIKAMKSKTAEPTAHTTGAASRDEAIAKAPSAIQMRNILVPLDLSEMSLKSLPYAAAFAKQFGAKLTLLHVVQPVDEAVNLEYPAFFASNDLVELERQLEDISSAKIPPKLPADIVMRHNFIFDGILEVAREIRADLIITTTHGYSGLKHLMMGSTAENIVRRAPCSSSAKSSMTSYDPVPDERSPIRHDNRSQNALIRPPICGEQTAIRPTPDAENYDNPARTRTGHKCGSDAADAVPHCGSHPGDIGHLHAGISPRGCVAHA